MTTSTPATAELRLAPDQIRLRENVRELVDQYAYGPPTFRFTAADVDRARAAGVLIELDGGAPIITDRALYRDSPSSSSPAPCSNCANARPSSAGRREVAAVDRRGARAADGRAADARGSDDVAQADVSAGEGGA